MDNLSRAVEAQRRLSLQGVQITTNQFVNARAHGQRPTVTHERPFHFCVKMTEDNAPSVFIQGHTAVHAI